jgi:hypothetical protein
VPIALCILGDDAAAAATRAIAGDLGIPATAEVAPLASALVWLGARAVRPWTATPRALPEVDRTRLMSVLGATAGEKSGGRLVRLDDGRLGWSGTTTGTPLVVGDPRDAASALTALRAALAVPAAGNGPWSELPAVDPDAVTDVIFGPPRALSDPASKAALKPYGVPVPMEELCASPSRAAAEAARIGFPVRIALASPDLRVWDQPDLAIDGVDNAARVRDVFRQITGLGHARASAARLLGVTVTATTIARALLRVHLEPLPRAGTDPLVIARIGFADPHGLAAGDATATVLPAPLERIEAALSRLRGAGLLLDDTTARRRETVAAIGDVLLRLAAFVRDRAAEIVSVEIHPLAVLVGGGIEVREACVTVGDAFVRSLESSAAS